MSHNRRGYGQHGLLGRGSLYAKRSIMTATSPQLIEALLCEEAPTTCFRRLRRRYCIERSSRQCWLLEAGALHRMLTMAEAMSTSLSMGTTGESQRREALECDMC